MSTVYKAKAPVTGRIVALKVLDPRDELFLHLAGERRLRQVFIEEAMIMGQISHDHVAEVIDCDEENGLPFIVLEYFAHSLGGFIGESYQVEQPSRAISVAKTCYYLIQALKGLERLHFSGIVHRDIKPYNLMITNDDRIKIIDFGLSRIRGEERMRIPGLQVGSPFYAAPEQEAHPEKADERADLYSLGVLAYRMLTGHLPGMADAQLPPSSYRHDLNREWDELLMKSISAQPDGRFATAGLMRENIEEVYAEWAKDSEVGCRYAEEVCEPAGQRRIRGRARRIMYKDARDVLGLDQLMRPRHYPCPTLEVLDSHHVRDMCTGLLWQSKGSGFTLDWRQAGEYVTYLNRQRWRGLENWRLPTMEELCTILQAPTVDRDFCLNSAFSRDIHWLWSSDWCTGRQAWLLDIIECFAERLDKDGAASVCAVSSS